MAGRISRNCTHAQKNGSTLAHHFSVPSECVREAIFPSDSYSSNSSRMNSSHFTCAEPVCLFVGASVHENVRTLHTLLKPKYFTSVAHEPNERETVLYKHIDNATHRALHFYTFISLHYLSSSSSVSWTHEISLCNASTTNAQHALNFKCF